MLTRITAFTLTVTLVSTVATPAITSGTTYWVAKTGSDSNTCTQARSQSTPKLTINAGLSCLASGDTLQIKRGTYSETVDPSFGSNLPSGSSWNTATTISAHAGDELLVILKPPVDSNFVVKVAGKTQYVVFNGLVFDGTNIKYMGTRTDCIDSDCPRFIRFSNGEIRFAPSQGVLGFTDSQFINMNIHHNGTTDFDHGMYIASDHNVIEKSQIHHNKGWGVHIYNSANPTAAHDNIVRNNHIYDNGTSGTRGVGIILSSGANNQAYNNIIQGNIGGVQIDYGAISSRVYNNIIYDNKGGCIGVGNQSTDAILKNNLCYSNWGGITDAGTGTIQSNDLTDHR